MEEEYILFLEEFGNIDFTLLNFMPKIRTVDEMKAIKKQEDLNSSRMMR